MQVKLKNYYVVVVVFHWLNNLNVKLKKKTCYLNWNNDRYYSIECIKQICKNIDKCKNANVFRYTYTPN